VPPAFLVAAMNPVWKTRWTMLAGAALAVTCGWWIATGSYGWPVALAAIGIAACAVRWLQLPFDVIALGVLIVGYVVGNRGFAQLSLVPGLPLLPAEVGLALTLASLLLRSALGKRLPVRANALNVFVLLWIVIGSVRIIPDARLHGAVAIRDFAMIYYALFFFVAQAQAENATARRFLERGLLWSTVLSIPLFELFRRFPDFFINQLTVAGTPLIFLKGDLVATFMAIGVLLSYRQFEQTQRRMWLLVALAGMVAVVSSDNRASLLGLTLASMALGLGRHWGLLKLQAAGIGIATLFFLGGLVFGLTNTRANSATRLYDRIMSIVDVTGERTYGEETEYKGDNNRFRLIWWRAVFDETVAGGPWLGLGFGYDLAGSFVRQYYPDSDEEFSTRSPHSIVLTTFGRTGALGLSVLLAMILAIATRTQRALWAAPATKETANDDPIYWLAAGVIFVSACFGVVLEGPMGAVVFWIVLGLASAQRETATPTLVEEEITEAGVAPRLRAAATPDEVTPLS
jgi:hypothetical protein